MSAVIESAVPGLEDRYQISTLGRVWSKPRIKPGTARQEIGGYLLSHLIGSNGYPSVRLADGVGRYTRTVHVMILEAFVGPRPFPDWDACHNDGNRKNCRLDNLRWDTRHQNMNDQRRHGTNPQLRRTHCPHGHEYNAENTRITREGFRSCRACRRKGGPLYSYKPRVRALSDALEVEA